MKPFFSVIICAFNRDKLLPRALDSLILQSEPDWEAVVVDDGSIDHTAEVARKYATQDRRISLVSRTSNGGTSAARNTGLRSAGGLFVTFLDSDDEYEPDHLWSRRQMLIENDSVEFLHGGLKIIGDPWVPDKDDPKKKIHINDCTVGGTFVVRRDILVHLGGFKDLRYADDADLYQRAGATGVVIGRTDHKSYIYHRDTPNQLTKTYGS